MTPALIEMAICVSSHLIKKKSVDEQKRDKARLMTSEVKQTKA